MKANALAAVLALLTHPAAAAPDFTTGRYTCDRSVEVPVTYVNTADGNLVILHIDGRQITLIGEPTASGARYAWPSDGSTYVWLTKENEATLLWRTPEGEAPLLGCKAT